MLPISAATFQLEEKMCKGLDTCQGLKVILVAILLFGCTKTLAKDIVASNENEIRSALGVARRGDRIVLAPGVYNGGFFQQNMAGVTITSQVATNPATLRGGTNALQLSDAKNVTIENIICVGQAGNGINIDDGGRFSTPASNIIIRNIVVRDMVGSGNLDGIKLSGVTGFLIEGVTVINWGDGGSGIDMVGSHKGLIQNSLFRHSSSNFPTTIRPKGGSKSITARANRMELNGNTESALVAGGTTGSQFFRFIDGDRNYEARDITFEGNVVVRCRAAIVFEGIDGGLFHHNYVLRPNQFMVRILPGLNPDITLKTRNGVIEDNILVYRDTSAEYNTDVNIGPNTLPGTFNFRRNSWFNLANPSDSEPRLPSDEADGVYGVLPKFDEDDAIPWTFNWGIWCVNAVNKRGNCPLGQVGSLEQAIPGQNAVFKPLLGNPFLGKWKFNRFDRGNFQMESFSQSYFRLARSINVPEVVRVVSGRLVSGGVSQLAKSDNKRIKATARKGQIAIEVRGSSSVSKPRKLCVVIESQHQIRSKKKKGQTKGKRRIELFNFRTGAFEEVARGKSTKKESTLTAEITSNAFRFIAPSGRRVRVLVVFTATGPVKAQTILIDQISWQASG